MTGVLKAEEIMAVKREARDPLAVHTGTADTGCPCNDVFVDDLDEKDDGSSSTTAPLGRDFADTGDETPCKKPAAHCCPVEKSVQKNTELMSKRGTGLRLRVRTERNMECKRNEMQAGFDGEETDCLCRCDSRSGANDYKVKSSRSGVVLSAHGTEIGKASA